MRLPQFVCRALLRSLLKRTADVRPPDVHIGGTATGLRYAGHVPSRIGTLIYAGTYMERWWVIPRNPKRTNFYFHRILRSDDDRALHDHPGWSISIVLAGGYYEVVPLDLKDPAGLTETHWRPPGTLRLRRSTASHRLVLPYQGASFSLFIMGRATREWGFHCPRGWRHWKDFTAAATGGTSAGRGPGCGED